MAGVDDFSSGITVRSLGDASGKPIIPSVTDPNLVAALSSFARRHVDVLRAVQLIDSHLDSTLH